MCGIAGVYDRSTQFTTKKLLTLMSEQMKTRGPDAEGIWKRESIGFAHRRLRVIDLDPRSDQPMLNAKENVCIVFNGEIYNYLEIKEELKRCGHHFVTESDTEVALIAYEQWGVNSFAKFNGMFAIAIADFRKSSSPQLFIARDRFGIKPLFYSENAGCLAFGSDLRSLVQVPWVNKEIDPQTLFWYLKFSHVPKTLSIFKNISQLEPGYYLHCDGRVVQKHSFYQWSEQFKLRASSDSQADWYNKTASTLSSAVRRQMVSDVPVGCFLSGGIDSSLILSEAVRINPKIETFTLSYSEGEFDETTYARTVAKYFDVPFHPISLNAKDFESWAYRLPDYMDQPLADPTLIPTLILCEKARSSVTVALSGDGGDELFFGYSYQRALKFLYPLLWIPPGIKNFIFSHIRDLIYSFQNPKFNQMIKALDVLQFRNESELFQNFVGTIGPIQLKSIRKLFAPENQRNISTHQPYFKKYMDEATTMEWVKKIEFMFVQTFLVDTVLAKSDRSGMAFGLEIRVPFLDHELLELSLELPHHMKLKGTETKHVLRNRLARELPSEIWKRPKKGFSIPIRDWMRGPLLPLIDQYLNPSRLNSEGIFDSIEVSKLLRDHRSGVMNHSHLLWSIIVFQLWNERNQGVVL